MFPVMLHTSGFVSLRWSEKNLLQRAFYKYFVPTGRGTLVRKIRLRKQEGVDLLHRYRT